MLLPWERQSRDLVGTFAIGEGGHLGGIADDHFVAVGPRRVVAIHDCRFEQVLRLESVQESTQPRPTFGFHEVFV